MAFAFSLYRDWTVPDDNERSQRACSRSQRMPEHVAQDSAGAIFQVARKFPLRRRQRRWRFLQGWRRWTSGVLQTWQFLHRGRVGLVGHRLWTTGCSWCVRQRKKIHQLDLGTNRKTHRRLLEKSKLISKRDINIVPITEHSENVSFCWCYVSLETYVIILHSPYALYQAKRIFIYFVGKEVVLSFHSSQNNSLHKKEF